MRSQFNRRQWLLAISAAPLAVRPILARAARAKIRATPIRLHSNENPYAPSEAVKEALTNAFPESNLYPSSKYRDLETLIAEREGLSPDHVVLGAGSHEILRMAATAYGLGGEEVITAYPTYEGLETYARSIGARVHRVPVDDNQHTDLEKIQQRLTQSIKLVFVCNPNNPTGAITPHTQLLPFVKDVSRRTVVLVDEAYYELVTDPAFSTMVPLVKEGANVIVSRTFSKIYGLAGLRVGYALARPDITTRLRQLRTSQGVNILGLRAAMAAYQDTTFVEWSRSAIAGERERIANQLRERGHPSVPSHANFIFFHLGRPISGFQESMAAHGILVGRPFPPYLDWCRLSIGKPDEMDAFLEAFDVVMSTPHEK